ncbi:hypothetical protein H0H81_006406 [Sphagnurus paluster]|uniref:Uncharacterized protein n=1 Tax=Sphagnurus paluster TaxID=117069 RepID=A0A9P7G270_9AGAR|nr:hypothetical protein H0H81_006406 [Sphagnurus paluster]
MRTPVGGLEDAFLIVNSLRYSSLKQDLMAHEIPSMRAFQNLAVDFSQPVSPRLASHALLHGLLRMKRQRQAADLAVSMMGSGIQLRSNTLRSIMRGPLRPASLGRSKPLSFTEFSSNPVPRSFADIAAMAQHPGTHLALEIFTVARKTHQNTRGMFGTLIAVCIINTEIILASLIFVFFVKEWQRGSVSVVHPHTSEADVASLAVIKPEPSMLKNLVRPIKRIFETRIMDAESIRTSLQALANLTYLLERDHLPFRIVTPLVNAVYQCPRVAAEVWIIDSDGKPKQVDAYTYFHDVLERLITKLPTKNPRLKYNMTSPLDLHACNSLLHYALRHRLSPMLAEAVLSYMTQYPSLQPDRATYNILLRAGTLIQDSELASAAIIAFRELSKDPIEPSINENVESTIKSLIYELRSVEFRILINPNAPAKIKRLLCAITTHLMHCISTGHPDIAAAYVTTLFPEILLSLSKDLPPSIRDEHLRKRRSLVARASRYGPDIFAVLINALLKCGNTTWAASVWALAKRAERYSWDGPAPWVLDVAAYTSRLSCLALDYHRLRHSDPEQAKVTLEAAWRCYRGVKYIGLRLGHILKKIGREHLIRNVGALPEMDARLANIALELFVVGRQPTPSKKEVQRVFDEAKELVANGEDVPGWSPQVQEIASDMVAAGLDVPPGLRHLFIGRWEEGARKRDLPQPQTQAIPYAYPEVPRAFSPLTVPVVSTPRDRLSQRFKYVVNSYHAGLKTDMFGPRTAHHKLFSTTKQDKASGSPTPTLVELLQTINERLGTLEEHLYDLQSDVVDMRITSENARRADYNSNLDILSKPMAYKPLLKYREGHGAQLARNRATSQDFGAHYEIQDPVSEQAEIGSTPPNFDCNVWGYNLQDIDALIVFYNDDFDIIAGDDLRRRIEKFCYFLEKGQFFERLQ